MIVVRHKFIAGRGPRGSAGRLAAVGKAIAHVKYIQHRPGEDREKGGRELFNEQEDRLDGRELRRAIKQLGDSRVVVHKLTLAPEINPADKKAFTREVMEQLSRQKGLDLRWFGVEHSNTEHHHIHVVVLGKDRHGSDVRIDLKDIDRVKEWGDRYLERHHPRELERSRQEREDRELVRRQQRKREREAARDERIREGLELPWLHKKIVREQLEPFDQWKEQEQRSDARGREKDIPYHQDTIEAAGRKWSKADSLQDLRGLNEYLWDNYDDRLPKDEYKKLVGWIKDKEQLRDPAGGAKHDQRADEFEWQGERYTKRDSAERLSELSKKLREGDDRLPFEDYQKLRGWMEYKDRERFSGALEKEIERATKKFDRGADDLKAAEGGRVLEPLQDQLMRNPVVGLFMTEAAIASQIVRSIPLDDRDKDYLKELRDELIGIKRELEQVEKARMPWDGSRRSELERLEQAIERVEEKRTQKRDREKEERERKRDDWDRFDPWGRF